MGIELTYCKYTASTCNTFIHVLIYSSYHTIRWYSTSTRVQKVVQLKLCRNPPRPTEGYNRKGRNYPETKCNYMLRFVLRKVPMTAEFFGTDTITNSSLNWKLIFAESPISVTNKRKENRSVLYDRNRNEKKKWCPYVAFDYKLNADLCAGRICVPK